MPHVRSGDARIFYRWDGRGDGPVLLLSNSLGTDLHMWDEQVGACGEKFRVLRYDTRGHGSSDTTGGEYDIEFLGRDVVALLDALRLERVHFCGLSLGGMTGQWLGANAPGRIDRLVLCCTSAKVASRDPWDERIRTVRNQGMQAVTSTIIGRWFSESFQAAQPAKVEPIRRMLLASSIDGYTACCAAVRDLDLRESNARITAPTLVVYGALDTGIPPDQSLAIAARVPGARAVAMEGMHLCNIESAAAFNEAVVRFLAA